MNKTELLEAIVKDNKELSKAAAGRALDSVLDAITRAVAKSDTVTLVGFGTFKQAKRAARTGRNPRTGEVLKIAAAKVPRFTAGAAFKAAVASAKGGKAK